MKDRAEYLDSIYKKKDARLKQIKKRRNTIAAITPVFLVCVAVCSFALRPLKTAESVQDAAFAEDDFIAENSEIGQKPSTSEESGGRGSVDGAVTAEPKHLKAIPFEAQYIRTNSGNYMDNAYPSTVFISSVEELNQYYTANKDYYDLERKNGVSSDTTIGFLNACDKYDEEYFKTKMLVLVILEEPSGSISHKVTSVEYDASEIRINIKKTKPEVGTCDMAQWHIIVEIDRINPTASHVVFD